jgi:demethylmenaquinone methyltransferase / 2-methoxy-6-polyprenyl-1,4-benzoquinol methylase
MSRPLLKERSQQNYKQGKSPGLLTWYESSSLGTSQCRSVSDNLRRIDPPLVLQHRCKSLHRVSPHLHCFWTMADYRSLRVPASQRLCSSSDNGRWLGRAHRRSRSSLVCRSNRGRVVTSCFGSPLSGHWDRGCGIQFYEIYSQEPDNFNVLGVFDPKARYVRTLFSKVPLEYDILLGLLTFAQDRRWRAYVVNRAKPLNHERILDVATGTGLLAADLARTVSSGGFVVGVDLTLSMLKTARGRLQSKGLGDRVDWVLARAEDLPFRDNCFGSASISLALRNVSDANSTFREMSRATGPGGIVISLDFARPPNRLFQIFYYDYILGLFPLFGRMVSEAWGRTLSYLGRSILRARTGEQIANLLSEQGLVDAVSVPLTAGIVCAVYGKKR